MSTLLCIVISLLQAFSLPTASVVERATGAPHPGVRLAADELSAAYKTGAIDPAVLSIRPEFNQAVFTNPRKYLPQLVEHLVYGAQDDFHIVKRIHDWIADNFAYEFITETWVYSFIPTGKTNCVGYSLLFAEMAGMAGIYSEMAVGYSRTYIYENGRQGDHAWNIVWIDGKRYIVDVTHAARSRTQNGIPGPKKPYVDDELFIKPEYKLLINLPYIPAYQLVGTPISFEEYLAAPRVRLSFLRNGLDFADDGFQEKLEPVVSGLGGNSLIRLVSDSLKINGLNGRIAFVMPPETEIRLNLSDERESYEAAVLAAPVENRTALEFRVPRPGSYRAQLEARLAGTTAWEIVYSFMVIFDDAKERARARSLKKPT